MFSGAVWPSLCLFPYCQTFRFDRYIQDGREKTDFYKDGQRLRYYRMPFGSGSSMCPGRYFAVNEIKQFLCLLLLYFDLQLVEGQTRVTVDCGRAGLGILLPSTDVCFRYRLRTVWPGQACQRWWSACYWFDKQSNEQLKSPNIFFMIPICEIIMWKCFFIWVTWTSTWPVLTFTVQITHNHYQHNYRTEQNETTNENTNDFLSDPLHVAQSPVMPLFPLSISSSSHVLTGSQQPNQSSHLCNQPPK